MGELGPNLLIALTLSLSEGERGISLVLILVFTLIIVAGAYIALKVRPPLLLQQKMHTTAQLPVRQASLVIRARTL
jgi:hypothetical protein